MMMQELEDRLKEQIDKLEHVRLAATELKDNLSGVRDQLCITHCGGSLSLRHTKNIVNSIEIQNAPSICCECPDLLLLFYHCRATVI